MLETCKECISYAICYNQDLITCDTLWWALDNVKSQTERSDMWDNVYKTFPNMERIRWETHPYDTKSRNIYERVLYKRGER